MKGALAAILLVTVAGECLAQDWEVVGSTGAVRFVYVEADGLKDRQFVAQVLGAVQREVGQHRIINIMLFDDKRYTPKSYPMTDRQMLHWKARYAYNPNTALDEFVWISVVDATTSPPKVKETKAGIRPGLVED